MFKKKCPFCFEEVKEYWDNNQYIIECQECLKKGLIVKSFADTKEDALSLWNTRVFDNHLLNNAEYVLNELKIFNEFMKSGYGEHTILKNNYIYSSLLNIILDINRVDYGFLVLPNATYIKCDDSHVEELMNYLGIETDKDIPELDEKIYMNLGIIRICNHDNCLMIVLPKRITKKQIDCVLNLISTQNNGKINSYCIYKDRENDYDLISFKDFNELYMYLDKVI